WHIEIARFLDRLAAGNRFEDVKHARFYLDDSCDAKKKLSALVARQPAPILERAASCLYRAIDIRGFRERDLTQLLFIRGVDRIEAFASFRRDKSPTDEKPVVSIDLRRRSLGRGCVIPRAKFQCA